MSGKWKRQIFALAVIGASGSFDFASVYAVETPASGGACEKTYLASVAADSGALASLLSRSDTDGQAIIDFLSHDPKIRDLFAMDAGVREGITLEEHTLRVYDVLAEQLPYSKIQSVQAPEKVDLRKLLKLVVALHDIGKPNAVLAGEKELQHQYTLPILLEKLKQYGFGDAGGKIAKAIVDNDVIGEMLMGRISPEKAYAELKALAAKASMKPDDFFRLQSLFYTIDAASYPRLRADVFGQVDGQLIPKDPSYRRLEELFGIKPARALQPPYDAATMQPALGDAFKNAPLETLEKFFDPDTAKAIHDGKKIWGMSAGDLPAGAVETSLQGPLPFYNRNNLMDGGIALYRGDVFLEGYFRTSRVQNGAGPIPSEADLIRQQPWFSWNPGTGKFELKTTGAQERLISRMPETVVLYRGAGEKEGALIRLKQAIQTGRKYDPSDLQALVPQERLKEIEAQLNSASSSDRARAYSQILDTVWNEKAQNGAPSVFLTTSLNGSEKWASPNVIEYRVPRSQLLELSRAGRLYVGIEYDYPELALLSRESWQAWLEKAKIAEKVAPPAAPKSKFDWVVSPEDP